MLKMNSLIVCTWQVMRKVFALLIAELKNLGATIIFSSFSRIIIDTGKIDLASAHAYCDCMLNTLQKRYCFLCVLLQVSEKKEEHKTCLWEYFFCISCF